jgi:hypothetical protein
MALKKTATALLKQETRKQKLSRDQMMFSGNQ